MRITALVPLALVAGCTYEARLPPSFFAEGAGVLAPGQTSITAVGGGGTDFSGGAIGGGARVRVGIGDDQEVGVEATAMDVKAETSVCVADCDGEGTSYETIRAYSGTASWKYHFAPHVALIAGLGMSDHQAIDGTTGDYFGTSVTGSIAIVASRPLNPSLSFYAGGRLSFAEPIGAEPEEAAAAYAVSGVAGLDNAASDRVHLYLEAGPRLMGEGYDAYFPWLTVAAVAGVRIVL
ncbi:MAG TPA: hypothetical protein VGG74_10655 [Kofleriaceae bacterium]|jgi:hypothetical protein